MRLMQLDGHDMRVIEGMVFHSISSGRPKLSMSLCSLVDGTDVEEYPIDLVTVSVAQRVSVLVTARNDTASNWLIHANMVRLDTKLDASHVVANAHYGLSEPRHVRCSSRRPSIE